tara:strand:- start:287 stop:535 length:249 start_codon:yes stop_codon:yes gene_type:complete
MKTLFITVTLLVSLSISAFANHSAGTVYADVNGLVCDFCARALEKVFLKREAVESIDVDLDEKVILFTLMKENVWIMKPSLN